MGVRGLTTFIAQHANRYLDPHELHDCNLIIDGDNLCSQLYKSSDRGLSAFGGNYDEFYRTVVEFYTMLKKCNVTPYVLLDGGYEMKKMKTTRERLRARIGVIKYIIPLEKYLALPLQMREVFVSASKSCNVKVYRCLFEADNEIAILARKLNCPVLSYDSDFYIFDGQYIPYVTITPKVYKKTVTSTRSEVEIIPKKQKGQKNVRRKTKKIVVETSAEADEEVVETTYNYLDCCIYTISNLTDGVLENDMLPLFAIMLGNDFISRKWFAKFFKNVSRCTIKKKKNLSPQQKKIYTLLNWLQHETLRSAIRKILDCVKHYQRPRLWYQIRTAMRGYRMVHSKSFEYFGFEEDPFEQEDENPVLEMDVDELMEEEEIEESEVEEEVDPEEADEEEQEEEVEDEEEEVQEADGFEVKNSDDDDFQDPNDGKLSDEDEEPEPDHIRRRKFVFPPWFTEIYNAGAVPRFLVDVLRCRRYINYPQVEDFNGTDSNKVSYPILNLIYSILHSPDIPPLYYYTRVPKQVRYEVKKIESKVFPVVENFDPTEKKNLKVLKLIFERDFKNVDEIFELIKEVPEAHQLYVLAMIYWMKRSTTSSSLHLQSVIIGLIAISIVDKKCEKVHRDSAKFLKNFGSHLKDLKAKVKENQQSFENLKETPLKSVIKNVTKQEALLTLENLIANYEISPKFQRKHADFRRNVVHTFSELQSVTFNLFSINPFLNYPFENIKIENYFNGLFLYNVYLNLKSRANAYDYIKGYIFNHSLALMTVFDRIYELCLVALPDLKIETPESVEVPRKLKIKNKTKKPKAVIITENDCEKLSESDGEFEDLNNKFSQLLRNLN